MREIKRRVQAAEDDCASRISLEEQQRDKIHAVKLSLFMVVARADCARAEWDGLGVLQAMPEGLAQIMRGLMAELPHNSINPATVSRAVAPFLPLSGTLLQALDAYQARGFTRWRTGGVRS